MSLCNITNLNSAFAAEIKARRGRGKKKEKKKTKASRDGFSECQSAGFFRVSIPFGPVGFDFIPIFGSDRWKQKEKSVGHTDGHVACFVEK